MGAAHSASEQAGTESGINTRCLPLFDNVSRGNSTRVARPFCVSNHFRTLSGLSGHRAVKNQEQRRSQIYSSRNREQPDLRRELTLNYKFAQFRRQCYSPRPGVITAGSGEMTESTIIQADIQRIDCPANSRTPIGVNGCDQVETLCSHRGALRIQGQRS